MSVVYITSRKTASGHEKIYHSSKHCNQLSNSNEVYEKDKSVLKNGWRLCSVCDDAEEYPNTADFGLYHKLSDPEFTAEDLDL